MKMKMEIRIYNVSESKITIYHLVIPKQIYQKYCHKLSNSESYYVGCHEEK